MVDALTWPKRLAAKLARFDGAYLRFTGPMAINVTKPASSLSSRAKTPSGN
jgi:hypothetical protein